MFYKCTFMLMFLLSSSLFANNIEDLKTFEAKFTQIIINNANKKIEYSGKIYIKEPSQIVWKYETPIIKNVYISKDFAIIDEPELEQAIFTTLKKEINIVKLLKSAKKIGSNIYVTSANDIDFELLIENRRIKSIKYEDEIENKITIIFTNIIQNETIDEKHFVFQAPDYYDIIRK
ncbi:MAG: outer-membrane lipoprotein carrier protein LolA [Campylobacteraceae bacterium]|nr:outer-membrane lipoprotein carrier protein LolA [Campylobacteraceae bacterium]